MENSSKIHQIRRKISQPFRRYKNPSDKDDGGQYDELDDVKPRGRSNTIANITNEVTSLRVESKNKLLNNISQTIFVRKINKERIHCEKPFTILVLGTQKVGKTSIIKRFVNGEFTDEYLPTISDDYEAGIFLEVEDKLKQFDLVFKDYSGELKDHYMELYREAIQNADGYILVHTKDIIKSFPEILEMVADINNAKKQEPSILVIENKCELKNNLDDRATRRSFHMDGVLNATASAKTNSNINESIALLIKVIDKKI